MSVQADRLDWALWCSFKSELWIAKHSGLSLDRLIEINMKGAEKANVTREERRVLLDTLHRREVAAQAECVKTCTECGDEYVTKNPRSKWCSGECKEENLNRRRASMLVDFTDAEKTVVRICPACLNPYETILSLDVNLSFCDSCSKDLERQELTRQCRVCSKHFKTQDKDSVVCGVECELLFRREHVKLPKNNMSSLKRGRLG